MNIEKFTPPNAALLIINQASLRLGRVLDWDGWNTARSMNFEERAELFRFLAFYELAYCYICHEVSEPVDYWARTLRYDLMGADRVEACGALKGKRAQKKCFNEWSEKHRRWQEEVQAGWRCDYSVRPTCARDRNA
jgi:hypothetical protein